MQLFKRCVLLQLKLYINRTPSNALKAFWNDELERLKHILAQFMGECRPRPAAGTLHHIKTVFCSSYKYKAAIRDAYVTDEEKHSDEILDLFLNKRIPEFWKCWNATCRKNASKQVVLMVVLTMLTLPISLPSISDLYKYLPMPKILRVTCS